MLGASGMCSVACFWFWLLLKDSSIWRCRSLARNTTPGSERFPVRSKLHQKGLKAFLFNTVFVGAFNAVPRPLVRKYGWHLMGFAEK